MRCLRAGPVSLARFALITLLLAAIVPTATGIGVSADARQKALRYVESGTAQLRLSRLLTEQGLIDSADCEGLLAYLQR